METDTRPTVAEWAAAYGPYPPGTVNPASRPDLYETYSYVDHYGAGGTHHGCRLRMPWGFIGPIALP